MESGVQEFLDNLASVLVLRKTPVVLCVVHSEVGLEVIGNSPDLVMRLGMLEVAKLSVLDQQARFNAEHEEEIRHKAAGAMAVLGKAGKAN